MGHILKGWAALRVQCGLGVEDGGQEPDAGDGRSHEGARNVRDAAERTWDVNVERSCAVDVLRGHSEHGQLNTLGPSLTAAGPLRSVKKRLWAAPKRTAIEDLRVRRGINQRGLAFSTRYHSLRRMAVTVGAER